MSKTLTLNFPNFEMAWEGLNEFLANNENEIKKQGYGDTYGTEMVLYNSVINVELARIPEDFNFGKALGYKNKKWTKLVNNYINFNYLDLVKSEVVARELKNATSYNYSFHFDNSHGSGKDCLISLTFQRRVGEPDPIVIYHTRASEATKRMIFDYLLIQRMTEYVYGKDVRVKALLYIPFMYINVEAFLLYAGYKGGTNKVLEKENGEYSNFQKRIINRFKEFSTKDVEEIKYKVHKRSAMHIQKDKDGVPLSKSPDLFAHELQLRKASQIDNKTTQKLNQGILL